MKMTSL